MLSLSCWISLLVSTLFTISTAHVINPSRNVLSSRQQVQVDIRHVDADTVSFNGWEISGCGTPQNMEPKLNGILSFLFKIKPHLEAVVADAQLGTRSSHGYTAFFKTSANVRKVISKYQALVDVNPVLVSAERAKVIGTRTPQPRFQCINENDPGTADTMDQCNRVLGPGLSPQHPVIVHTGTERISICPSFFTMKKYPPPQQKCPTLGADGKFRPGEGALLTNGFAYMVYALVMMYNRELYETHADFNAMWDMQYAVELTARQSLLNPESYGFYAGGESG
ncbi:MAG: hypothetical protein L6R42_009743 [Xanthoria sp. 1 TBL-2021]|nr:MAG: hypothetical protein L6R42_009743 [Xanthoria sp. 1 TBL-2021]